jgi:hypothetical protein
MKSRRKVMQLISEDKDLRQQVLAERAEQGQRLMGLPVSPVNN